MVSRRIVGSGSVEGVEFVRTQPGEVLASGRRRTTPIAGSEFSEPADTVIVAIGQGAEPIPAPGEKDGRGVLKGDGKTFRTSVPRLYVAGDFMTGPTTVIESIAAGRKAAEKIAQDLAEIDSESGRCAFRMQRSRIVRESGITFPGRRCRPLLFLSA